MAKQLNDEPVKGLTYEELASKVVALEDENKQLKVSLQGFEDLVVKVTTFLQSIESIIPAKLTGWWRWLIMGFVTMRLIIDTIQAFAAELDAWKNRKPANTSENNAINSLNQGVAAAYRTAAKI